jgi:hypothetical protein
MAVDAEFAGASPHPFLADVGVVLVELNGQPGRILWYPAADLDSATLVIEAVLPGRLSIGNGSGDLAEIPVYETNMAVAMLRDQEAWLRRPGISPT